MRSWNWVPTGDGVPLSDPVVHALREARVRDPFAVLGLHHDPDGGFEVRAWLREATTVAIVRRSDGRRFELPNRHPAGLFVGTVPGHERFAYDLCVRRGDKAGEEIFPDPYAGWPLLAEFDLERFRAGQHHDLGSVLGAHPMIIDGVAGVRFATWAPNAERVSVIGDWNGFDGRWHPMRPRDPYGVWELFIPGVAVGTRYKFELRGPGGNLRIKADPFARAAEEPPATASVVWADGAYTWNDATWLAMRSQVDHLARPMAVFECHLGSWRRGTGAQTWPNYRDFSAPLIAHCRRFGFTHVEFLPLAQHPFEGSWGYQVTGQYAPNSRHGTPDDLRALIDDLHQAEIGVLIDFVPGHFPKDDFALATFDGTPTYEYGDPREGEHKTWGTLVFNYRRPEVRNFLLAAALFWLRGFHIDGLRVDAVSSMLYRDYDREQGEWVANEKGDNANLEAVSFLQEMNDTIHAVCPGVVTIAEESTAWQGVTAPTSMQGLGFDLKWNMGWMHDTLDYLELDPLLRPGSHKRITFHQWYAYDDKWVLPLSHDEVVHGKHSLIDKVHGDWWQRRAQLRLLIGWQATVPGRPLLFQGAEYGQGREWAWGEPADPNEAHEPERQGLAAWLTVMLGLYRNQRALHVRDDHRDGFQWVEADNAAESIVAFLRKAPDAPDILVACNFTPVPRPWYPLGVPQVGMWTILANSDTREFGGSGAGAAAGAQVVAAAESRGVFAALLHLDVPPMAIVVLQAPWSATGNGPGST